MSLRTHKPSGRPPYPLILIEGQPKWGKSCAAYEISTSDRVDRTFVFDLGEGSAEGYARLGPYEVVDLDGTWSDFHDQLTAATSIPSDPEKPNVIVIDSVTELWVDLKSWVDERARNSKAGMATLARDPDAEVNRPMNLWNDAKDRWAFVINTLRRWPGIAIITAQAEEKTAIDDDGKPAMDRGRVLRTYKVDAEKTTVRSVTAVVRFMDYRRPVLKGIWSLDVELPEEGVALPQEHTLEHLVFNLLKPDGEGWSLPTITSTQGLAGKDARQAIYSRLINDGMDAEIAKHLPVRVWKELEFEPEAVITPETMATLVGMAKSMFDDVVEEQRRAIIGSGTAPDAPATGGATDQPAATPPDQAAPSPQPATGGESPPEPPPSPETATQGEPPDPLGPTPEHIAEIEALIRPNLETMTVPKLSIDVVKAGIAKPARTKAALIDQLVPFLVAEELELEAADRAQNGTAPPPPDAPEFDVDGQGADGPSDGALNLDNPPTETSEQLVARITQGVDRMPPREVAKALTVAGENPAGTIDELRARLVEYRVNRQAAPAAG